jgi:ribosomal protein S18 acetylase RimI-like enzyme
MPDKAPAALFSRVAANQPPLDGDPQLRRRLGGYIATAVPDFYDLLPIGTEELADMLGATLGLAGSELENASMGHVGDDAVAVVTWLPLDRLEAARRAAAIALMRSIDRSQAGAFLASVGQYGKIVEPICGEGVYLSRVAVAPAARGMGLGRRAVMEVIDAATGQDVWLHVSRNNVIAIRTYEGLGFQFAAGGGDYASRAMRRPGSL